MGLRGYLTIIALGALCLAAPVNAEEAAGAPAGEECPPAEAPAPQPAPAMELATEEEREAFVRRFLGERLTIEVGLLLVFEAGEAVIGFDRDPARRDGYIAWIETEASWMATLFTTFRSNRYESYIRVIEEDGHLRFRADRFERKVVRSYGVRTSTHTFDHQARIWHAVVKLDDTVEVDRTETMEPGAIYDDFLVAMYNFRAEVYGPIVEEQEYVIRAIPKKGVEEYKVRISSREDALAYGGFDDLPMAVHEMIITVPEAIFGLKTGEVRVILSKNHVPLRGIVEDAVGYGDVIGNLDAERSHLATALRATETDLQND